MLVVIVPEAWTAVGRNVLVTLLETIVFAYEVQVVTSEHDGTGHLGLGDDASQNTASDRHVASERALLVDVCTFDGLFFFAKKTTTFFMPFL